MKKVRFVGSLEGNLPLVPGEVYEVESEHSIVMYREKYTLRGVDGMFDAASFQEINLVPMRYMATCHEVPRVGQTMKCHTVEYRNGIPEFVACEGGIVEEILPMQEGMYQVTTNKGVYITLTN